jgi:3-dehydroquinate dehydratase type I
VSYHNFKGTPPLEELQKNVQEAKKKGADIVKIATYVEDVSKNVILFDLLKWAGEEDIALTAVGMGDRGNISRVMAPMLGSALYYAPMDEEYATAPGQLTKADLEAIWGHLSF